jgi:RNA polymerase sigma factor (sigma-70 family)
MLHGMVGEPAERIDQTVRAACGAGDFAKATAETLRRYGSELFGFLVGLHGDHDLAGEAFSIFSERLWRSLTRFQWECSLRTWCYHLARNAAVDVQRGLRHERHLESAPEVLEVAAQVRTSTLSALRTENRSALERLRDELSEEDRALLVLRIDRELGWRDVALVLAQSTERADALLDDAALTRETARLRKRLQLVTERLRATARERKLV